MKVPTPAPPGPMREQASTSASHSGEPCFVARCPFTAIKTGRSRIAKFPYANHSRPKNEILQTLPKYRRFCRRSQARSGFSRIQRVKAASWPSSFTIQSCQERSKIGAIAPDGAGTAKRAPHSHLPPHLYKCGGWFSLKSGLQDQSQIIKFNPRFPSLLINGARALYPIIDGARALYPKKQ